MEWNISLVMIWLVRYLTSEIWLLELLFSLHTYIQKCVESMTGPTLPSTRESRSFEDFSAFYIKMDNADPIVWHDQTKVTYLHPSGILSPSSSSFFLFPCSYSMYPFLHVCQNISINFSSQSWASSTATDQPMVEKWLKWISAGRHSQWFPLALSSNSAV